MWRERGEGKILGRGAGVEVNCQQAWVSVIVFDPHSQTNGMMEECGSHTFRTEWRILLFTRRQGVGRFRIACDEIVSSGIRTSLQRVERISKKNCHLVVGMEWNVGSDMGPTGSRLLGQEQLISKGRCHHATLPLCHQGLC